MLVSKASDEDSDEDEDEGEGKEDEAPHSPEETRKALIPHLVS